MLWKDKINLWKNGEYQTYPNTINKRFFFEIHVCNKNMTNEYEEKFIENDNLEIILQNYSSFIDYINESIDENVVSFKNLSSDSLLIIPIPRENKDFTTIKDFCDNASIKQQKEF